MPGNTPARTITAVEKGLTVNGLVALVRTPLSVSPYVALAHVRRLTARRLWPLGRLRRCNRRRLGNKRAAASVRYFLFACRCVLPPFLEIEPSFKTSRHAPGKHLIENCSATLGSKITASCSFSEKPVLRRSMIARGVSESPCFWQRIVLVDAEIRIWRHPPPTVVRLPRSVSPRPELVIRNVVCGFDQHDFFA